MPARFLPLLLVVSLLNIPVPSLARVETVKKMSASATQAMAARAWMFRHSAISVTAGVVTAFVANQFLSSADASPLTLAGLIIPSIPRNFGYDYSEKYRAKAIEGMLRTLHIVYAGKLDRHVPLIQAFSARPLSIRLGTSPRYAFGSLALQYDNPVAAEIEKLIRDTHAAYPNGLWEMPQVLADFQKKLAALLDRIPENENPWLEELAAALRNTFLELALADDPKTTTVFAKKLRKVDDWMNLIDFQRRLWHPAIFDFEKILSAVIYGSVPLPGNFFRRPLSPERNILRFFMYTLIDGMAAAIEAMDTDSPMDAVADLIPRMVRGAREAHRHYDHEAWKRPNADHRTDQRIFDFLDFNRDIHPLDLLRAGLNTSQVKTFLPVVSGFDFSLNEHEAQRHDRLKQEFLSRHRDLSSSDWTPLFRKLRAGPLYAFRPDEYKALEVFWMKQLTAEERIAMAQEAGIALSPESRTLLTQPSTSLMSLFDMLHALSAGSPEGAANALFHRVEMAFEWRTDYPGHPEPAWNGAPLNASIPAPAENLSFPLKENTVASIIPHTPSLSDLEDGPSPRKDERSTGSEALAKEIKIRLAKLQQTLGIPKLKTFLESVAQLLSNDGMNRGNAYRILHNLLTSKKPMPSKAVLDAIIELIKKLEEGTLQLPAQPIARAA